MPSIVRMHVSVLGLLAFAAGALLIRGQPLQSQTCNSELNANYNGTLLNNQTADSLGDCCYRCQSYPGCNIYVYCPLEAGCDNGYGIIVNAHECNLKIQNLTSNSQAAIAVWSRGSATPFSSGQTGALSFPPLSRDQPRNAPGPSPAYAPGPAQLVQISRPATQSASSSGSNTGAIVGGVVGGIVGVALIITVAGLVLGWRPCGWKRQRDPEAGTKEPHNYFGTHVQDQLSKDGDTELAEFNVALKPAGQSSGTSSAVSTPGVPIVKTQKAFDGNAHHHIEAHSGVAPLVQEGSGVLPADALLARVGSNAKRAAVGVAFADEEAATKLGDREVHSTWRIEPRDVQCKLRNGFPVMLGQGGCGSVYLGVLYGMRDVAIKVVNNPDARQQARFVREIMMLKACHDPNIVQFLGAAIHEDQTLLVMTYMPGGDLYGQIAKDDAGNFRWSKRGKSIALDIIKGLSFLHRHQIMHLDIKSPNILLTDTWEARIADVGLGKIVAGEGSIATQGASYMWAAPEQLIGEPCSIASDIFALGVVIWELCTGEQPHGRQCRPLHPTEAPPPINELITRCRALNPAIRPSITEVYQVVAHQG